MQQNSIIYNQNSLKLLSSGL